MRIREMIRDDLDQVVQLEQELFKDPWSLHDLYKDMVENEFSNYYVVENENEIVGYFGLWILFEQAQITTIGTSKKHQRQHIGSMMMDFILEQCQENECEFLSLEVRISNLPAQKLYEKYGLEKVSVRKDYYSDHEDAYLMVKAL